MQVCVCAAVLVAVTVWNQTGSRNQFRTRRVHQQLPAEQQSWEDVRENILNYDEEGGGEQDQVGVHTHQHTHIHTVTFKYTPSNVSLPIGRLRHHRAAAPPLLQLVPLLLLHHGAAHQVVSGLPGRGGRGWGGAALWCHPLPRPHAPTPPPTPLHCPPTAAAPPGGLEELRVRNGVGRRPRRPGHAP